VFAAAFFLLIFAIVDDFTVGVSGIGNNRDGGTALRGGNCLVSLHATVHATLEKCAKYCIIGTS
jgi:hypothetical protein